MPMMCSSAKDLCTSCSRCRIRAVRARQVDCCEELGTAILSNLPATPLIRSALKTNRAIQAAPIVLALVIGGWRLTIAAAPIVIDARKQLFLGDYLIASMSRVRRVLEPAQKVAGHPVVQAT